MRETFGMFLRKKRMDEHCPTTKFAEKTGLSAPVISQLESDTLIPTSKTVGIILLHLNLSQTDKKKLQDLATEAREPKLQPPIPLDTTISDCSRARVALRVAKEMDFTDKEWAELYHSLPQKGQKGEQT